MINLIYKVGCNVKIHDEVLAAARRLCASRRNWSFTPAEIVHALPHLNERSVRTHVVSRCCVNAPSHHAHRWPYFRRLRRGLYAIEKDYRASASGEPVAGSDEYRVAETDTAYAVAPGAARSAIHAVIVEEEGRYTAECLELAVVTQGNSLDETLANLREGVDLYMSDEDPALFGLTPQPRLILNFETTARPA